MTSPTLNRRGFLGTMGACAAHALTASPARAEVLAPAYPADYAKLIEQSKGEGRLFMYSNMSPKSWIGVQKVFSRLYPWIKVDILELNSDELMERYLAERGTGKPTCDFLTSGALEKWTTLVKQNEIDPYASPEQHAFPDWSVPSPGLYTIAIDPLIIIYNKALLPEAKRPKGIESLASLINANPGLFRRKVVVFAPDAQASSYLAHKQTIDRYGDRAWDWFSTIGANAKPESQTGVAVEKILTGEYVAGYYFASGIPWQSMRDRAKASLLGWDFIHDGQPMALRASAVPKGARNPASAKLWLDVTLSFEGQKGLVEGGRTPLRADVTAKDVGGEYTYSSVVEAVGQDAILQPSYDPKQFDGYDEFLKRLKHLYAAK